MEWGPAHRHIRFHPRPASNAVVRPEVSAWSSTKSSLGSRNKGGRGAAGHRQGSDCESMPHRPAVYDPLELPSLVEVADTCHGCGRIECGDLFGTRKGWGFHFYNLSYAMCPFLPFLQTVPWKPATHNVPIAEQCHKPGAVKSRTRWARFWQVNGILIWGEGLAFCILETPIN